MGKRLSVSVRVSQFAQVGMPVRQPACLLGCASGCEETDFSCHEYFCVRAQSRNLLRFGPNSPALCRRRRSERPCSHVRVCVCAHERKRARTRSRTLSQRVRITHAACTTVVHVLMSASRSNSKIHGKSKSRSGSRAVDHPITQSKVHTELEEHTSNPSLQPINQPTNQSRIL